MAGLAEDAQVRERRRPGICSSGRFGRDMGHHAGWPTPGVLRRLADDDLPRYVAHVHARVDRWLEMAEVLASTAVSLQEVHADKTSMVRGCCHLATAFASVSNDGPPGV